MSFLSIAKKPITDVRQFLKDASNNSGLKLTAEKGAVHHLYFPPRAVLRTDEAGNPVQDECLWAIEGNVHSLKLPDGKYKEVMCLKDIVRKADDGTVLNDGSCPFCNRTADSNDIFFYRKEIEEKRCMLTGTDREKYLKNVNKTLSEEKKVGARRSYMYAIVIKFASADSVVLGKDGLPEYELKVMRLSGSRLDDIEKTLRNAGTKIYGAEVKIQYDDTDDKRLMVSQSTISPVFEAAMITKMYPAVLDKINKDIEEFDWEGIPKAFPEWEGLTTSEANTIVSSQFSKWDEYKKELAVNSNAMYLEYSTSQDIANPPINMGGAVMGQSMPGIPDMNSMSQPQGMGAVQMPNMGAVQMPQMPNMGAGQAVAGMGQMPQMPQMPNMGQSVAGMPQMPQMPNMGMGQVQQGTDVNAQFADLKPSI